MAGIGSILQCVINAEKLRPLVFTLTMQYVDCRDVSCMSTIGKGTISKILFSTPTLYPETSDQPAIFIIHISVSGQKLYSKSVKYINHAQITLIGHILV